METRQEGVLTTLHDALRPLRQTKCHIPRRPRVAVIREWPYHCREYEQVHDDLQQPGTGSAHRTIDQMGDRETRQVEDYLHRISKALVHEAVVHGCDMIVFEKFTDIRERMPGAKKFYGQAFRCLYDYVAYKAHMEKIEATQVDLAYTSKRCSKCGTTLDENRTTQARFCCQKCEYEVNADYNTAKNIGF